MNRRVVVTTPEADADARDIDAWWTGARAAAPDLFLEELADAFERLSLVRATRYHVYYLYTDELLVVIALWGAVRGSMPSLASRAGSARDALATGGPRER